MLTFWRILSAVGLFGFSLSMMITPAMADPLTMLSLAVTTIGTGVTAMGTIAAGKAAQASANYQAQLMEKKGKEEQALGQRQALQQKKKTKIAKSALQARAAASGFQEDPNDGAEIAEYGTLQQQMAAWGGRSKRQGLEESAAAARMSGQAAASGAKAEAFGTILGGVGSAMFDAYSSPYGTPMAKNDEYTGKYATGDPLDLSFGRGWGYR